MARYHFLLLVILSTINSSLQTTSDNEVETEESNPFAEAASEILKDQNAKNVGSMVNNLLQSGAAGKIGDALSQLGRENAGQILQGLGSLMQSNKEEDEDAEGDSTDNLVESLGSLMGALQGAGEGKTENAGTQALLQGLGSLLVGQGVNGGAALLQGLGTLLGNQGGRGGQGGLDPALIGSLMNAFVNQKPSSKRSKSSRSSDTATKKPSKTQVEKSESKNKPDVDMSDLLSLAGAFLSKNLNKNAAGGLINFLPMIMQALGSFSGPEARKRAESHSDHSSKLPPYLEQIHIAFDNFLHSDMGKYVINSLGADKMFNSFTDENGRFNYPKFGEMIENRSFRRHWIRMATDRIVEMLQLANDPKAQKVYLANIQFFVNSFLKAQGYPKATLFDPIRPTETISALVNYVAKKYLDLEISSRDYVKSAIVYLQDIIRMSQKSSALKGKEAKELSDKLADTLNLEIIEPIARVNRAYRFAKVAPACDRYVLCLVNEENRSGQESLPSLKKLLYKGSSLLAAWFLSDETGTPFLTFYSDITDATNCKGLYSDKCHDFHVEEVKVTTEYVHNEL